jgi:hypothetical protein
MSALPPKADMCSALTHVRFGPEADISGDTGTHVIRRSGCENECCKSVQEGRIASREAVRSSGIVTFNRTGCREHSFDGAFPQLFGRLFQSGQALGGELYQGGGARKF